MSQDYTVAKELASLKEIKQSAEQRISDLSLNALNYVNDHRLHKTGGGGTGGGGVLVVNANVETGICDKTWKEINDASFAVIKILDDNVLSTFPVVKTNSSPDGYVVKCVGSVGNETIINNAVASSENDYPVVQFD